MKVCIKCQESKHRSEFQVQEWSSDGFSNRCNVCVTSKLEKIMLEHALSGALSSVPQQGDLGCWLSGSPVSKSPPTEKIRIFGLSHPRDRDFCLLMQLVQHFRKSWAEKQHQSGVLQVKIDVDRVGVKGQQHLTHQSMPRSRPRVRILLRPGGIIEPKMSASIKNCLQQR